MTQRIVRVCRQTSMLQLAVINRRDRLAPTCPTNTSGHITLMFRLRDPSHH